MNLSKILPEDHVKTAILMAIDEKKRISVASIIKGSALSGLILAGLAGLVISVVLATTIVLVKLAVLALIIGLAIFTVGAMLLLVGSVGKLSKVKEFTKGLSDLNKLIYRSQQDSSMTEESYKKAAAKFYESTELQKLLTSLYS